MKKLRAALARVQRPARSARTALMTECVRECAGHLAAAGADSRPAARGDAARKQTALTAAIGMLLTEYTDPEPSADRSFESVLRVGRGALEAGELPLAERVAGTAVQLRPTSKGAWRLRGQALEAQGKDEAALAAFDRHLELASHSGGADVARRLDTLREKQECLAEADRLVPGARLRELPSAELPAALGEAVARLMREHGAGDPRTRALAELYGRYSRLAIAGRTADPLLGGSEPIGLAAFRRQVEGRSVCVVAGGDALAATKLGAEIDAYDVVVRVDAYRIKERGTGRRTDVHALSHRSPAAGWRREVTTRLVFADTVPQWRTGLRSRLVPGAQQYVGDRSLSHPVRDPELIGEDSWAADTSTGFAMARLLDFLDVTPRIDLFGFDQPGQLHPAERKWLLARARDTADATRLALR